MTVLKIKDRDHLVKDIETGAVINTDTQAYEKRIKLRFETQRQRDQLRDAVREINTIKSEMHEMKSLLIKLVEKEDGR
jgi:hypothetical protein|tara:strand:- start:957 stop:1190 length:234 start_codon:yes stop_codon:yes gene_type:complete